MPYLPREGVRLCDHEAAFGAARKGQSDHGAQPCCPDNEQ